MDSNRNNICPWSMETINNSVLFELLQNAETFLKRFTVNNCNIIYRSYKVHAWSIFCYFRFGSTGYGKFFPRQNGNDFLINLIERKSEKLNIINVVLFTISLTAISTNSILLVNNECKFSISKIN
jgi:hypothetical protein